MGYYYRALNKEDIKNLQDKKPLVSVKQVNNIEECKRQVTSHIMYGSRKNSKKDYCWISACKEYGVCASEFSIPQTGNYNTAGKRKPIAVIKSRSNNENYTLISGKDGNNSTVRIDLENITFEDFIKETSRIKQIDTFVFDLSYPSGNVRTGKGSTNPPLIKYSYWDWVNKAFILTTKGKPAKSVSAVASGNVQQAKEILILNQIPLYDIVKVLSLIEIDILYAIYKTDEQNKHNEEYKKKFEILLGQIITGIISIAANPYGMNEWLFTELYENNQNMFGLAHEILKMNNSLSAYYILSIYSRLKDEKRKMIHSTLKILGFSVEEKDVAILEDEIFVAIYDPECHSIPTGQLNIQLGQHNCSVKVLPYVNNSYDFGKSKLYDLMLIIDYDSSKNISPIEIEFGDTELFTVTRGSDGSEKITKAIFKNNWQQYRKHRK
ncbi:MAG: hypothetical protein M0P20_07720 [Methanocorpusculum sp.]|nr:hypothetical protein [Methanocorpusculum sp.]